MLKDYEFKEIKWRGLGRNIIYQQHKNVVLMSTSRQQSQGKKPSKTSDNIKLPQVLREILHLSVESDPSPRSSEFNFPDFYY